MESPGVNKFDRLADALALVFIALVAVWMIRERSYGGLIVFPIVVLFWFFRVRKSERRLPNGPAGLMIAFIAAFFAGPLIIVLIGIFRPKIALPTALAVVALYAALAIFGRWVRLRAQT